MNEKYSRLTGESYNNIKENRTTMQISPFIGKKFVMFLSKGFRHERRNRYEFKI